MRALGGMFEPKEKVAMERTAAMKRTITSSVDNKAGKRRGFLVCILCLVPLKDLVILLL